MTRQSPWPDALFAAPDGDGHPPMTRLRTSDHGVDELPLARWHGDPDDADLAVLARADEPVLDIGCGPGRHVGALTAGGRVAMGIDTSAQAVLSARRRGASAVRGSVFGPVPEPGRWATILLLDGNIGIGGDESRLLRRVAELLAARGRVLVELSPPSAEAGPFQARVEHAGRHGSWFPWARVTPARLTAVAEAEGYRVQEVWEAGGRWFADLWLQSAARLSAGAGTDDLVDAG